jgi:inosine-uridine nucleoside N-ribohydrolase
MTNLGAALDRDPETFKKLKRIVMMGGSVRRGYDDLGYLPTRGPEPEYNIAMDVEAAKKVFTSGVPLYVMPLDSTQLKLDETKRELLFTQSTDLTDAIALLYLQWSRQTKNQTPTMFDAVAVAYAIDPTVCPVEPLRLRVDDQGYTREEPGAANSFVCLRSDSDNFFRFYMPRLLEQKLHGSGSLLP